MSRVTRPEAEIAVRDLAIESLISLVVGLVLHDEWTVDAINNGWLDDLADRWWDLSPSQLGALHAILANYAHTYLDVPVSQEPPE